VGDVLATIHPFVPPLHDARTKRELEARVRAAEASAALAASTVEKANALLAFQEKEAARLRELVAKDAAPARDLERAELEVRIAEKDVRTAELQGKVAKHQLEVARAALGAIDAKHEDAWIVRAPLRGRVLRVLHPDADVVTAGTPLLEVADTTDLEVVVSLLTADAVRVRPGARTILERWGGPIPLEGHVRAVEPSGYTKISALGVEEQRVDVVIDIVSPPAAWASLGDGFRVHTKTMVHRDPDALKTASAAVFRDGDAWAVFVVEGGRLHKRAVHVERRNGPEASLGPGLLEGTMVVAFPSNALAEGTKVVAR
jgi:HlyD family secretion protein